MLTELKPEGFPSGVLLAANAGLDESNVESGYCIGWPGDPLTSIKKLRKALHAAVLITDSTCRPRRQGVTALALVVSGFHPLRSLIGTRDLFGRDLRMTQEAVADQLATAANMLMGNAGESVPAVIIRNHGIAFTDYEGWVPGIAPEADLFRNS
jgi:F420-0:gamma-glutamyl ligase